MWLSEKNALMHEFIIVQPKSQICYTICRMLHYDAHGQASDEGYRSNPHMWSSPW